MPVARFQMPDGRIARFEVPEGTSPEQAQSLISAQIQQPESSLGKEFAQGVGNLAAGLVRGAGSIGATLLAPVDMAKDALNGKGLSLESNRERRAMMDAGLKSMGADPESLSFKGGKLGGEVLGTAGAGGLLANGVKAAAPAAISASPRLAQLVAAIESGGFATGGPAATGLSAKAADLGVRTAGGAINGAVSAGLINPEDASAGALIGGALPGAVKAGGAAGEALRSKVEVGANKLMQSAIKPTIAQLRTGDAANAVQTLLDYGISPTKAGVNKLRALIDGLNDEIASKIGSSTAVVDKAAVAKRLADVEKQFSSQVAPTADLNAIRAVADDFANHPIYAGASLPVQAAQELKQGTYRTLAKKYGQIGSAETEAQKGLARGLKEEIAQAVPGVQALNAEESRLISTLNVAERRALMELNKNPMGLAALASNPLSWAAFMADRSSAFKALAARALNRTAQAAEPAAKMIQGSGANPLLRSATIAIGADE
jgi:hypothetical protein